MRKNILKLSKQLISVNSEKENAKGLNDVLEVANNQLHGFNSKKYLHNNVPSSLYYNTKNPPQKFKVILNAHLDIVSGKRSQFKPIIKGDKLFGRGAQDMKAAAAVEILVFKELTGKLNYPLGLQLVTDEEIGGFDTTRFQIENGVKSDFVIAGEETNLNISHKAKGIIWAKISCKGISAHGAHVWEGDNAIKKMTEFLTNKLYPTFPLINKREWKTTVNTAKIETTNSTFNKVPSDCSISIDLRYIPEEKNIIVKKLKKIIPKEFKLEIILNETSQFTPPENNFIKTLQVSAEKITKGKCILISDHGASDIRHYDLVNVPGVCFGPSGDGLHTDNEWVSIKSLEQYYQVLKDFLLSLNKSNP